MNKVVALLIGGFLAGMLAIGGCGSGDGAPSTNAAAPAFNSSGVGTQGPLTGTPGTGTTSSGQDILVRLGTDNLVESEPPINKKLWVAIVTDTAGHPIAGVTVNFTLRSGRFQKGTYARPGVAPAPQVWTQVPANIRTCPDEDTNPNGILDPGEDLNGNGLLDSLGHAAVVTTASVSDAIGIARATIVYPKDVGTWAEVTLVASSGVGTPATATFSLDGLASDYSDLNVGPPGFVSPFGANGTGSLCSNLL